MTVENIDLSQEACDERLFAKLFGLDPDDSYDLFHANNTLCDLWRIAKELTDGRVKLPKVLKDLVNRIDLDRNLF